MSVALKELLVRSSFLYLALVQDKDLIGVGDGAESMGNDEHSASVRQGRESFLDVLLGFRVKGGSGFVEHDDPRILQDCASNGNTLLLSTRQTESTLSDLCFILVGEGEDFLVDAGRPASFIHLLVSCLGICVLKIVHQCLVEKNSVLGNNADVTAY